MLVICVISCLQKRHYNFTATTKEHLKPQKAPYQCSRVHSPWSLIQYSYFFKNHILSSYKCSQKSNFKAELIKMLLAGRSVRFGWVNILIFIVVFKHSSGVLQLLEMSKKFFFLWFTELLSQVVSLYKFHRIELRLILWYVCELLNAF